MASKSSMAALATTADPEVDVLGAKAAAEPQSRARIESFIVESNNVLLLLFRKLPDYCEGIGRLETTTQGRDDEERISTK